MDPFKSCSNPLSGNVCAVILPDHDHPHNHEVPIPEPYVFPILANDPVDLTVTAWYNSSSKKLKFRITESIVHEVGGFIVVDNNTVEPSEYLMGDSLRPFDESGQKLFPLIEYEKPSEYLMGDSLRPFDESGQKLFPLIEYDLYLMGDSLRPLNITGQRLFPLV